MVDFGDLTREDADIIWDIVAAEQTDMATTIQLLYQRIQEMEDRHRLVQKLVPGIDQRLLRYEHNQGVLLHYNLRKKP